MKTKNSRVLVLVGFSPARWKCELEPGFDSAELRSGVVVVQHSDLLWMRIFQPSPAF